MTCDILSLVGAVALIAGAIYLFCRVVAWVSKVNRYQGDIAFVKSCEKSNYDHLRNVYWQHDHRLAELERKAWMRE